MATKSRKTKDPTTPDSPRADQAGRGSRNRNDELQDYEALLVQHLPFIERVAARFTARDGLSPDEVDDFVSWAKSKLIENDYAYLRKFRGESALTTYLTVVLSVMYRDYRMATTRRWRPSAEARRLGPVAIRLEELVYRDGYTTDQAAEILRSGGVSTLSDREVTVLLQRLPSRTLPPLSLTGKESLHTLPSGFRADALVEEEDSIKERQAIEKRLLDAISGLSTEDQLILRLRFFEGSSIAEIARGMGLEQKPLYRRLERLLTNLRSELEGAGITRIDVTELLESENQPSRVQEPLAAAFLDRSRTALRELVTVAPAGVIEAALTAPTDVGGVARFIADVSIPEEVRRKDPLAQALARGAVVKEELLSQAGGAWNAERAAEVLGITPDELDERRKRGDVLGFATVTGEYLYPVCQFTAEGVIEGFAQVNSSFQVDDPWTRLSVLLTPTPALEGLSVLDALRLGDVQGATAIVRAFGEQGG